MWRYVRLMFLVMHPGLFYNFLLCVGKAIDMKTGKRRTEGPFACLVHDFASTTITDAPMNGHPHMCCKFRQTEERNFNSIPEEKYVHERCDKSEPGTSIIYALTNDRSSHMAPDKIILDEVMNKSRHKDKVVSIIASQVLYFGKTSRSIIQREQVSHDVFVGKEKFVNLLMCLLFCRIDRGKEESQESSRSSMRMERCSRGTELTKLSAELISMML